MRQYSFGISEVKTGSMWRAVAAEFVGTVLLLSGCLMAGSPASPSAKATHAEIEIGVGAVVTTMVAVGMPISGAHFNPAVTFALMVVGRTPVVRGLLYVGVQCAGGVATIGLLRVVLPSTYHGGLGIAEPDPMVTGWHLVSIEAIAAGVLLLAACAVGEATLANGTQPLTIGLAVVACHAVALKYTGCGLNPARVLGPAVIHNKWNYQWEYWVGELFGGAVGAILYDLAFGWRPQPSSEVSSHILFAPRTKNGQTRWIRSS